MRASAGEADHGRESETRKCCCADGWCAMMLQQHRTGRGEWESELSRQRRRRDVCKVDYASDRSRGRCGGQQQQCSAVTDGGGSGGHLSAQGGVEGGERRRQKGNSPSVGQKDCTGRRSTAFLHVMGTTTTSSRRLPQSHPTCHSAHSPPSASFLALYMGGAVRAPLC